MSEERKANCEDLQLARQQLLKISGYAELQSEDQTRDVQKVQTGSDWTAWWKELKKLMVHIVHIIYFFRKKQKRIWSRDEWRASCVARVRHDIQSLTM